MLQTIKNRGLGYWLTLLILSIPFTFLLLSTELHISLSAIHRSAGVIAFILLILMIKNRRLFRERYTEAKWLLICVCSYFLSTLAGQLLNFSPIYYLSGLNNNVRFFVFFFSCILFLRGEERDTYIKVINGLFWLNFVVSLYQFLVLDIKWDYLGGIFGVTIGCSSSSNNLLVLTVSISVFRFVNGREKAWVCLLTCIAALLIAAMAELRMFFVMFAVIVVLSVLMTKLTHRNLLLLLCSVLGLLIALRILFYLFPFWKAAFNWESIAKYMTSDSGYMGKGDFNRLTAVPKVWTQFLGGIWQKLFGLGMGNCDFGFTAELTPAFYSDYAHLNYTLFSSGFVMLETGLVGTVLYVGFFILLFFAAHHLERSGKGDAVYCQLGKIFALYALILYIYDISLRSECGYLIFFALALPFIGTKKNDTEPHCDA